MDVLWIAFLWMRFNGIWEVNVGLKDILLKRVRLFMETEKVSFLLLLFSNSSLFLSLSLQKFQMHLKMRWPRKLNFRMSYPSFESVWITHTCLMVRQCFFSYFMLTFLWPAWEHNFSKELPVFTVYFPSILLIFLCWCYLTYRSYTNFFSCPL